VAALAVTIAAAGLGAVPAPAAPPGPTAQNPEPSGGTGASATKAANPLADTAWRLVEIQSMNGATGTIRPDDPSLFTMRLNADGTANMQLDCNHANGKWTIQPGPGGSSGSFEFGPLAVTRALCAPPNLDERVTALARHVRSYLVKDGRLFLNLAADGGILVWEPQSGPAKGPVERARD
jgi:heat shock protein HslJ